MLHEQHQKQQHEFKQTKEQHQAYQNFTKNVATYIHYLLVREQNKTWGTVQLNGAYLMCQRRKMGKCEIRHTNRGFRPSRVSQHGA